MAAVQLGRELPETELFHIFDSRIPTIGVGESTNPAVPRWLSEQTGLSLQQLHDRCDATLKEAGCFEGWGARNERFLHRFQPTGETAIHLDASKLVHMLGDYVRGKTIDAYIESVRRDGEQMRVELRGRGPLHCDYVIDARGFPPVGEPDCLELSWIPTNCAVVQFTTPLHCPNVTRNVVRPHGWVFMIPLGDHTSVGYIYDRHRSTRQEVAADLDVLLAEEGGRPLTPRRLLPFPNFTRRTFCDGSIMRVGNAASFMEPLEALSIGTVVLQLRSFVQWLRSGAQREQLPALNQGLCAYLRRNSLFLAWHYSEGSRFDTPFWRSARQHYAQARKNPALQDDIALFDRFIAAGHDLRIDDLHTMADKEQWVREVFPRLRLYRPFGNFSELNVAQVGHGIGYFATETRHHAEHR